MPIEENEKPLTQFQKFLLIRLHDMFLAISLISFGHLFGKLIAGSLADAYISNLFNCIVSAALLCSVIYIRPQKDVIRLHCVKLWQKIDNWL